ncbi:hypothetical protein [Mycobacterium vicinigordonae]|uniref:Uncharacterized protein n=1 Tax=Mycobacterium vicinigordonae TaxID=1719132 RepID=A0A7D6HXX2_9MYCO|nr:hypothetical protein [Mycobacterium vicinigordonae]QLL07375.1 hypothetical protein H0P51_27700 [Mycobacterium vicinigordonae]
MTDMDDRRSVKVRIYLGIRQLAVATALAIGATLSCQTAVHADPPADVPVAPFPDIEYISAWYNQLDPDGFSLPGGVWFLTPSGLNCGIWDGGGFGCAGDIPGAPPDDTHIAWFNGNRAVHHGWTAAMQFPAGQAERTLPRRSFVSYNSTTCAITPDSNTYCGHGEFKFLITPAGTWFKGWNDRRSYVCNAYGSCPP